VNVSFHDAKKEASSFRTLFSVENQTYWHEYDAVQWFSQHGVQSHTSGQLLGETGRKLFNLGYGRRNRSRS
jgi:hypothetical protein